MSSLFGGVETTAEKCRELIANVRMHAHVDPEEGKVLFGDSSRFAAYFAQIGHRRSNAPKGVAGQIDRIIEVKVFLSGARSGTPAINCEGPLVSNRVLFDIPPTATNKPAPRGKTK